MLFLNDLNNLCVDCPIFILFLNDTQQDAYCESHNVPFLCKLNLLSVGNNNASVTERGKLCWTH
jgi:hypothetical protein